MKVGRRPIWGREFFAKALLGVGALSGCTRSVGKLETEAPASPAEKSHPQKTGATDQAESEASPALGPTPSPFRQVVDVVGSVTRHGGVHYLQTETFIQDLSTGEILGECPFLRGYLASGLSLFFLARMSSYSACPDQPLLMRKKGDAFQVERSVNAHQLLVTRYKQGTLGVVVPHRSGPPWGYELVSLEGGVTPPRPQKAPRPKDPESEDPGCYTLLEQPEQVFGFESGALVLLGDRRCEALVDAPYEEESSAAEDESPAPFPGPVAETWRPGKATSTVTNLPLISIQSSVALHSESVWVLGEKPKANEETGAAEQTLLEFDGNDWKPVQLPQGGPFVALGEGPNPSDATQSLWLLTDRFLISLKEEGRLRVPDACPTPHAFWFEKEEAWLSCEEGLFTTDDRVVLPRPGELEGDAVQAACEKWEPRPANSPPPLFGPRTSGGCGQRDRRFETPKRPGKPGPYDPDSEFGW